MKNNRLLLLLVVIVFLAACTPGIELPSNSDPTPPIDLPTPSLAAPLPTPSSSEEPPPPLTPEATLARQALAGQTGVPSEKINLVSIEAVDWSDSCLDYASPETMCAQVITPGYRMIFAIDGQNYEVHTDLQATNIAFGPDRGRTNPRQEAVISLSYEGGIAGLCDQMQVFADGQANKMSCRKTEAQTVPLTSQQLDQLLAWQAELAPFEYAHKDQAVADAMSTQFIFMGRGSRPATSEEQGQIMTWTQNIFQ